MSQEVAANQRSQVRSAKWIQRGAPLAILEHPDLFRGRQPVLVLLDSALWDLARLWMLRGFPRSSEVADEDIDFWCQVEVPRYLDMVAEAFPHSAVAFQIPPPVREAAYGRSPGATEKMAWCIRNYYYHYYYHYYYYYY